MTDDCDTQLVPIAPRGGDVVAYEEPQLSEDALKAARASKSKNTTDSYKSAWRTFEAWCAETGSDPGRKGQPTNPIVVANYLSFRAKTATRSTVEHAFAAIRFCNLGFGHFDSSSLRLQATVAGLRNTLIAEQDQAEPLRRDILKAIASSLDGGPTDARDRAILLLGTTAGLRISEISGLDLNALGDGSGVISETLAGIEVRILKGKTATSRRRIVIQRSKAPTCVAAVSSWLAVAQASTGSPAFRQIDRFQRVSTERLGADYMARILKARVEEHFKRQGMTAAEAKRAASAYSGHSMRVGLAVEAIESGVDHVEVAKTLGHASTTTTARYSARAGENDAVVTSTMGF